MTDKVFATTIGAEAYARDEYQGEFPIRLNVRMPKKIKGRLTLVVVQYQLDRKPTNADLLPVGRIVK